MLRALVVVLQVLVVRMAAAQQVRVVRLSAPVGLQAAPLLLQIAVLARGLGAAHQVRVALNQAVLAALQIEYNQARLANHSKGVVHNVTLDT